MARKKTAGRAVRRVAGQRKAKAGKKKIAAQKPARQVVVTVADDHRSKIRAVAAALRARGMKVESVLQGTGMITGTCSKPIAGLRRVPGVSAVETQTAFQLPPPDAFVQ
jgi:hypothetical protein